MALAGRPPLRHTTEWSCPHREPCVQPGEVPAWPLAASEPPTPGPGAADDALVRATPCEQASAPAHGRQPREPFAVRIRRGAPTAAPTDSFRERARHRALNTLRADHQQAARRSQRAASSEWISLSNPSSPQWSLAMCAAQSQPVGTLALAAAKPQVRPASVVSRAVRRRKRARSVPPAEGAVGCCCEAAAWRAARSRACSARCRAAMAARWALSCSARISASPTQGASVHDPRSTR